MVQAKNWTGVLCYMAQAKNWTRVLQYAVDSNDEKLLFY